MILGFTGLQHRVLSLLVRCFMPGSFAGKCVSACAKLSNRFRLAGQRAGGATDDGDMIFKGVDISTHYDDLSSIASSSAIALTLAFRLHCGVLKDEQCHPAV